MNPIVWTPTDEDRTNLEAIREALQTGPDTQSDAAILSYALRADVAALGPSGGQSTVPVSSPEPAHTSTEDAAASAYDSDQVIIAHTDGACSGNPGPGGWAVVFSQGGKEVAEHSGGALATTNNRMELTAVREALRRAPESTHGGGHGQSECDRVALEALETERPIDCGDLPGNRSPAGGPQGHLPVGQGPQWRPAE
jgi:hypothetical protein